MEIILTLLSVFGVGAVIGVTIALILFLASKVYEPRKKSDLNEKELNQTDNNIPKDESDEETVREEVVELYDYEEAQNNSEKIVEKDIKAYFKRGLYAMLEDSKPKPGKKPSGFLQLGNSIKHIIKAKIDAKF